MKSPSLAPQTGRIIEAISRLECIKPFVLVGGTALFKKDEQFTQLQPVYDITSADIETYIKSLLNQS